MELGSIDLNSHAESLMELDSLSDDDFDDLPDPSRTSSVFHFSFDCPLAHRRQVYCPNCACYVCNQEASMCLEWECHSLATAPQARNGAWWAQERYFRLQDNGQWTASLCLSKDEFMVELLKLPSRTRVVAPSLARRAVESTIAVSETSKATEKAPCISSIKCHEEPRLPISTQEEEKVRIMSLASTESGSIHHGSGRKRHQQVSDYPSGFDYMRKRAGNILRNARRMQDLDLMDYKQYRKVEMEEGARLQLYMNVGSNLNVSNPDYFSSDDEEPPSSRKVVTP